MVPPTTSEQISCSPPRVWQQCGNGLSSAKFYDAPRGLPEATLEEASEVYGGPIT